MQRKSALEQLRNEVFDLCIIGGGASGVGSALDAALRGLKVALIEKDDFAAATSSKSTKLIHGGVRYLEQAFKNLDFAQLKQVRHGLEERHIVLANAPHLARPLALVTPVFSWIEGLYFTIGLTIYGWFASGKDSLPKSRWLSKAETLKRMPTLSSKLHSAVMYYDGQLDDARYCLAIAQSAAEAGATAANHVECLGFHTSPDGKIEALIARDVLRPRDESFQIRAKAFLNCTGAYADAVRQSANTNLGARIKPSKGVHIVLPLSALDSEEALLIPKTPDGRVVFALPFAGETLVGTTDDEYKEHIFEEPLLEAKEVDYLIETFQPYVAEKIDRSMVKAGFGGLRPLIAAQGATKGLVRDHEVERDAQSGLFSLLGGKWTTYRLMAKDAVDQVCDYLGVDQPCSTETRLLYGAEGYRFEDWKQLAQQYDLEESTAQYLMRHYGARAFEVAALTQNRPDLKQPVVPGYIYICAEIIYAAQKEMACTVRDFIARRIRLEISDWAAAQAAAPVVARYLGEALGWSEKIQSDVTAIYIEQIAYFKQKAGV